MGVKLCGGNVLSIDGRSSAELLRGTIGPTTAFIRSRQACSSAY